MAITDTDIHIADRHQEFLALIRMVGYALDAAESLGATAAAAHMEAARLALVNDLQGEFGGLLSSDGISRLAEARAGHC